MNASAEIQIRVNEALKIRRQALIALRKGDRFEHRFTMSLTHLPLKMARAWKQKQ